MSKIHIGRKFVAFIIVLVILTVLGILNKGDNMAPYIVGLFTIYTTGNVVTKGVTKNEGASNEC